MKFSFLIPVFNLEKYIEIALNSIYNQNFSDFEVILVDDGSTDNSFNVVNDFKNKLNSEQKKNFHIYKTENQGSGCARNFALQKAIGEYVLFLDGDDFFAPNAIDKIAEQSDFDILIFGALTVDNGKLRSGSYSVNKIPAKFKNKTFNKNDFKNKLFKFPKTAWSKAYRRIFLIENKIKFQEIKQGQDQLFFVDSMLQAQKIKVLNENIYCYYKNRYGSITSNKRKKEFYPIDVFYAVHNLVKNYKDADIEFIDKYYFLKAASFLHKVSEEFKVKYFIELEELFEFFKKEHPNSLFKFFSPKINDTRLKLFLFRVISPFY